MIPLTVDDCIHLLLRLNMVLLLICRLRLLLLFSSLRTRNLGVVGGGGTVSDPGYDHTYQAWGVVTTPCRMPPLAGAPTDGPKGDIEKGIKTCIKLVKSIKRNTTVHVNSKFEWTCTVQHKYCSNKKMKGIAFISMKIV